MTTPLPGRYRVWTVAHVSQTAIQRLTFDDYCGSMTGQSADNPVQPMIRPGGDGMADTNAKVMAMVEQELKKNARATNEDLIEKAKKIDRSIGKLTLRQFHARYPLQVKRRKASGKRRKAARGASPEARRAGTKGDPRAAVRNVLTQLVRETAGKDGAALVDVVAGLDGYVDRVMKAAGK